MTNVPLSSQGHLGAMTGGAPGMNTCSCLHQLQIWKLLQWRDWVVFPEGLNRELKALQFDFEELPLWNVAIADEPTQDLPLIEVDHNGVETEDLTTTLQTPNTTLVPPLFLATPVEPACDIATAINLHIEGALGWLQWTPPQSQPPSPSIVCWG